MLCFEFFLFTLSLKTKWLRIIFFDHRCIINLDESSEDMVIFVVGQLCAHTHTHIHIYIYVCVYIYIYIYIHVCVCVGICNHISMYMRALTYPSERAGCDTRSVLCRFLLF